MLKKETLKALIDFFKITINTLFVAMLAIAVYNVETKGSIAFLADIAIFILGITLIITFIIYFALLIELQKLPETVKLDVNLNDGLILDKDEKFKITIEKDDKGRICIRRG